VVDRAQPTAPEQVREQIGIDLVAFIAAPGRPAAIADDHLLDERVQEVVQPLGLRPLLNGQVDGAAHAADEFGKRTGLSGQDSPGHHAPARLAHRGDGAGLVAVPTDILGRPFHESRSRLGTTG